MGYYIETPQSNRNKAANIIRKYPETQSLFGIDNLKKGYVPVVVISNPYFEAAGIAFDKQEYEAFTDPNDGRPITKLQMRREDVIKECPSVEQQLKWL